MKKILLLVFLLCNALTLNAWVFLDSLNPKDPGWLLPKILQGQQVRVCVDVWQRTDGKKALYRGEQQAAYYAMSAQIVYNAYQSWFDNLRMEIRRSERKKEFKDLLSRLPKKAPIQFINISPSAKVYKPCSAYAEDEVDLRVEAALYPLAEDTYQEGVIAFRLLPQHTGLMKEADPQAPTSMTQALRQAGYTLGLAAEAAVKEGLASPVFAWNDDIPSVMKNAPALTCDDADALANAADYALGSSHSPRQGGWLGFCPQRRAAYWQGASVLLSEQQAQTLAQWAAEKHDRQDAEAPQAVAWLQSKLSAARAKAARYQFLQQTRLEKQRKHLQQQTRQALQQAKESVH